MDTILLHRAILVLLLSLLGLVLFFFIVKRILVLVRRVRLSRG